MGPGIEIQTFECLTLLGRRFFFRAIDVGNNEVLFASQTYKSERQRNQTARRLGEAMGAHVMPGRRR
jgi:hypothetical protein